LAVILAAATVSFSFLDAWLAGGLARLARVGDRLTEAGVAMLLTLIFAACGIAYGLMFLAAAVSGDAALMSQWWIPAFILGFEALGTLLAMHYVGVPPSTYRHSGDGWSWSRLAPDSNTNLGVLGVIVLVSAVLGVAAVPVWLVARARAKRDGIDMGFLAAFQVRVARPVAHHVRSRSGKKHDKTS
jgi:hypothetical protein